MINRNILKYSLTLLVPILLSLISTFFAYQYQPDIELEIGHGRDHIYMSRIYDRQSKLGEESFRRIKSLSNFFIPYLGNNLKYNITIEAQTDKQYETLPELIVYANKKKLLTQEIKPQLTKANFVFTEGKVNGDFLLLYLINNSEKTHAKKPILINKITISPEKMKSIILPKFESFLIHLLIILFLTATFIPVLRKNAIFAGVFFVGVNTFFLLFFRAYLLPFLLDFLYISISVFIFSMLITWGLPQLFKKLRLNPLRKSYDWLLVILVLGFLIRLIILFFPGTIISDIDFHAHRFHRVYSEGEILQTSMTPEGTYKFPYPTLLYLLLSPFKFITGLSYQTVLKFFIVFFDNLIPLLIFLIGIKLFRSCSAGVLAAAVYSLFPLNTNKFLWGICTEIFAIFIAWLFITIYTYNYQKITKIWRAIIPGIIFMLVLFSHFGTAMETGLLFLFLIFGSFLTYTSKKNNKRILTLSLVLLISLIVIFLLYYINFVDMMVEQVKQVMKASTGKTNGMEKTSFQKFIRGWRNIIKGYGIPILATFIFSFVLYTDKRRGTLGYYIISTILLTVLTLYVIYIFSPLTLRWLLFSIPAAALITGWGLSRANRIPKGFYFTLLFFLVICFLFLLKWHSAMFAGPYHTNL